MDIKGWMGVNGDGLIVPIFRNMLDKGLRDKIWLYPDLKYLRLESVLLNEWINESMNTRSSDRDTVCQRVERSGGSGRCKRIFSSGENFANAMLRQGKDAGTVCSADQQLLICCMVVVMETCWALCCCCCCCTVLSYQQSVRVVSIELIVFLIFIVLYCSVFGWHFPFPHSSCGWQDRHSDTAHVSHCRSPPSHWLTGTLQQLQHFKTMVHGKYIKLWRLRIVR